MMPDMCGHAPLPWQPNENASHRWVPLPLHTAQTCGSAGGEAPLVVPLAPRDITQHSVTLTDSLSDETVAS